MKHAWIALLVTCAVCSGSSAPQGAPAGGAGGAGGVGTTTARPPHRTLDRKAAELAWRSWLQSPEGSAQNGPPRRITTKSLFITPLVCPKGQRLDRDGCVQVVTVNKDEHQRILLEQLNALFTSGPDTDVLYDYGDGDPGPLQLSIPIGLEPQAAPLQGNQPAAQPQELQLNYVKVDKKQDEPGAEASIEAELELLKIKTENKTGVSDNSYLSQSLLTNFLPLPDKPKRDSLVLNDTNVQLTNNATNTDEGQKEVVFGHVNVDPVLLYQNKQENITETIVETTTNVSIERIQKPSEITQDQNNTTTTTDGPTSTDSVPTITSTMSEKNIVTENEDKIEMHELKKEADSTKLNPENDYSDIGEAIKIISRYAEVTTDDNFSKNQKKFLSDDIDDSFLGTRTKLQHRRNKLKQTETQSLLSIPGLVDIENGPSREHQSFDGYYRYPIPGPSRTPPPNYPFRHLQDYWPNRNQFGGVYNTGHENHRRHHHSYNYFRPHGGYPSFIGYQQPYSGSQGAYPGLSQGLPSRRHLEPNFHSRASHKDLYNILGIRNRFINSNR